MATTTPASSKAKVPFRPTRGQARFAFTILLIINVLNYADRYVLPAVLPKIRTDLGRIAVGAVRMIRAAPAAGKPTAKRRQKKRQPPGFKLLEAGGRKKGESKNEQDRQDQMVQ